MASCKETLKKMRIPIISEDVLGTYGRTIIFDSHTNNMLVRTVGKGEKII